MSKAETLKPIRPSEVLLYLAIGLFLGTVGLLMYQAYTFLKFGNWPPVSLLAGLAEVFGGDLAAWASNPTKWIGVHKILNWIPMTLVLGVAGVVMLQAADEQAKTESAALARNTTTEQQ